MTCRMPAVEIPDDVQAPVAASGPGIAAFVGQNGTIRVDIFLGLELDGFKRYSNISESDLGVTIEFFSSPTVTCLDGYTNFNPQDIDSIFIQVLVDIEQNRLLVTKQI